jgi:hypothetical protein
MWNAEIVSNNDKRFSIEFSTENKRFVKTYTKCDNIQLFVDSELIRIESLSIIFEDLKQYKNIDIPFVEGWLYKLESVEMQYDSIEIIVGIKSEHQEFSKIFIARNSNASYLVQNEITKVTEMVQNSDIQSLSMYFGQEVILEWQI